MRISGGRARGIVLQTGGVEGVRPATDRLRQAVFSSLGAAVMGRRFLDLFAGTGAYGLEALSRGAAAGVFVEKNRNLAAVLESNLQAVSKSMSLEQPSCRIITADVLTWKALKEERFDLIFAGPPYRMIPDIAETLFARANEWLAEGPQARLLFEMPGELEYAPPPGWKLCRRLGQGRRQPTMALYARPEQSSNPESPNHKYYEISLKGIIEPQFPRDHRP